MAESNNWIKYPTGYGKGYTLEPLDERQQQLQEWIKKNPGGLQQPIQPGEKMNLDDTGAQSLQDAMRLRMQLPR